MFTEERERCWYTDNLMGWGSLIHIDLIGWQSRGLLGSLGVQYRNGIKGA